MFELTIIVVTLVAFAAVVGVTLFRQVQRKDRFVARLCDLFESEDKRDDMASVAPEFRHALVQSLRTQRRNFRLSQFVHASGVEANIAHQVAEEIYRGYLSLAYADGVIDQKETVTLNALAELLELSPETVKRIELEAASRRLLKS